MKKTNKLFKVIVAVVIAITLFGVNSKVQAVGVDEILQAGSTWISTGEREKDKLGGGLEVDDFVTRLIGIGQLLVAIAILTLVIVSIVMAIKWITATPDKKAKLQQQLIGLVVATFVIFGAVGIWNAVRSIMGQVENTLM